ncbi:MAG: hypothetical protein ABIP06_03105 [Pyrinomonadaceae bacterium]
MYKSGIRFATEFFVKFKGLYAVGNMWKKSLSEKIAQVFKIVGCLFLILVLPSLIVPVIYFFGGFVSLQMMACLIALILISVFGIGFILFVGYAKHASGILEENKILPLWIGTFLYNILPLILVIYQLITNVNKTYRSEVFGVVYVLLSFWWIAAVCLSLTAIYDELKYNDYFS